MGIDKNLEAGWALSLYPGLNDTFMTRKFPSCTCQCWIEQSQDPVSQCQWAVFGQNISSVKVNSSIIWQIVVFLSLSSAVNRRLNRNRNRVLNLLSSDDAETAVSTNVSLEAVHVWVSVCVCVGGAYTCLSEQKQYFLVSTDRSIPLTIKTFAARRLNNYEHGRNFTSSNTSLGLHCPSFWPWCPVESCVPISHCDLHVLTLAFKEIFRQLTELWLSVDPRHNE